MSKRILIVDDEKDLVYLMEQILLMQGFEVRTAQNGLNGMQVYKEFLPDLVLLDVNMPLFDGFEVARKIRAIDKVTKIFFISSKTMEQDVLKGFEIGANDYIRKPFSMRELVARVSSALDYGKEEMETKIMEIGSFQFNVLTRQLTGNGQTHVLPNLQAQILQNLIEHKGRTVTSDSLIAHFWNDKKDAFLNASLHQHIYQLRSILQTDPSLQLQNVRGVGYTLVEVKHA